MFRSAKGSFMRCSCAISGSFTSIWILACEMIEKTVFLCFFLLVLSSILTDAVDRSKFRTCKDTGFCRAYRPMSGPIYGDHYRVDKSSHSFSPGRFSAKVQSPSGSSPLNLAVSFYGSGSVRVKLSEDVARWQPGDILMDNGDFVNEFKALTDEEKRGLAIESLRIAPVDSYLALGFTVKAAGAAPTASAGQSLLVLHLSPLRVEMYSPEGELQVSLNERALLHFEASAAPIDGAAAGSAGSQGRSEEDRHGGKKVIDYGEDGLAHYADGTKEERKEVHGSEGAKDKADAIEGDNFGGHRDSMPRGPRSVGLDIAFPYAQHVYGIPEHATSLSLPTTAAGTAEVAPTYDEPYRLYNLDVFEYEIGNPMALYGNIPLLLAHGKTAQQKSMTAGVFWFNPSETFVDITDGGSAARPYKQSRWLSESGEVDVFLLPGPDAASVYRQYTALAGTQQLPPLFALGYHQCRWNYRDERDVAAVEGMFEQLDYPVDVIWLDIEHTDGKRYFTWDKRMFPNPLEMQANVTKHGRKMVTIVDPHIKRDDHFPVHKEATSKGLYIKNKDGGDFDGWCWPGSSSYLDFTSSVVRQWWASQFGLDKYIGSTMDLFTWNDMNEPSVFNGPEVSMPKDAKNLAGVEHREWHNLYGIYMQMATALGLTVRSPQVQGQAQQRPFVLTRSFWAGSQRYGAMWTGDNTATWPHLQIAAPMLLSINLGGLSFAGADVGGFFGEPTAELFTRWYQAGAFTPFFRGHAHLDTKRREPWVFGEPYTSIARSAAMQRYSLLPLWYTIFYEAYATGLPVMRPMFLEFPEDSSTFAMDHQWMLGSALLVAPVTNERQTSVQVYLPSEGKNGAVYNFWYDLETLEQVPTASSPGALTTVAAPLAKIPVFIRPGSIVPRKLRLRRSSKLMHFDPFTLVVAPVTVGPLKGTAQGALYLDDERSLAHEVSGAYAYRSFSFADNVLTCTAAAPLTSRAAASSSTAVSATGGATVSGYDAPNTVERIVIAGQVRAPKKVTLVNADKSEVELVFQFDAASHSITIKKPDARVVDDWSVRLTF